MGVRCRFADFGPGRGGDSFAVFRLRSGIPHPSLLFAVSSGLCVCGCVFPACLTVILLFMVCVGGGVGVCLSGATVCMSVIVRICLSVTRGSVVRRFFVVVLRLVH